MADFEVEGRALFWAVSILGLILLAWGAYREYFAEDEDTEGKGSILTNGVFMAGVALLASAVLYSMYRMLT